MYRKTVGKRSPGWTRALSVRHEYATSGPARRRAASAMRHAAARDLRVGGYREAQALANLAVRGLQLAPGELKSVDTYLAPAETFWSGNRTLLNGIARGDDITERNGRQVTLKSVEINLVCRPSPVADNPVPQVVRFLLVYDRQTNATALTIDQVLSATGSAHVVICPKNLENRDRFLILRDMKFGVHSSSSANFQSAPKMMKVYQTLNLPVTFNAGDAATVADITTGSLYGIIMSDADPASAVAPMISYSCRVRYADN